MYYETDETGGYAIPVWKERMNRRTQARRKFWTGFSMGLGAGILIGIHLFLIVGTWVGWL